MMRPPPELMRTLIAQDAVDRPTLSRGGGEKGLSCRPRARNVKEETRMKNATIWLEPRGHFGIPVSKVEGVPEIIPDVSGYLTLFTGIYIFRRTIFLTNEVRASFVIPISLYDCLVA